MEAQERALKYAISHSLQVGENTRSIINKCKLDVDVWNKETNSQ